MRTIAQLFKPQVVQAHILERAVEKTLVLSTKGVIWAEINGQKYWWRKNIIIPIAGDTIAVKLQHVWSSIVINCSELPVFKAIALPNISLNRLVAPAPVSVPPIALFRYNSKLKNPKTMVHIPAHLLHSWRQKLHITIQSFHQPS